MRHAFNKKTEKDHDLDRNDNRFGRRMHKFSNSAYRSAKQDAFLTGRDAIDAAETDQAFIDSLNVPSFAAIAEQGRR